jgi:CheY-like chemotaxis protein
MLDDLGYEVGAVAASLQAGLAAAAGGPFDVAVLDVNLNGEKSFPIADRLLAQGTPVVFASGYGISSVREFYPDALVIQKPFLESTLADALARALAAG